MNKPRPKDKPFVIPKSLVWEAYRRVAANKGAPGVDGQALEEFEADLRDNLYVIWNRMSSGSYFPPPVRAVEIPKPHSPGTRVLGVPTSRTGLRKRRGHVSGAAGEPRFHRTPMLPAGTLATGRARGVPAAVLGTTGRSILMSRNSSTPFPGTLWSVRCRR